MSAITLRILIAVFFIAHGLIHLSLTTVPTPEPAALKTPFWPSWRRPQTDPAWLASRFGADPARMLGSALWVLALAGFVLAGLGLLGVPGLHTAWPLLAAAAAILSLVLHLLFWHPWLVLGVLIDVAILAGVFLHWPAGLFKVS